MKKDKLSIKSIFFIMAILLLSISLVSSADFTPQGNINLRDYYNITGAPYVNATLYYGNASQMTGTISEANSSEYWDDMNTINATQMENNDGVLNILVSWLKSLFYSKTENIDATGYNITADNLEGVLSWNNLTDYPVACPDGTFVMQINDSNICASPSVYLYDTLNVTNLTADNIIPKTDSSGSIGSSSLRYLKGWFDEIAVGDLNVVGTLTLTGDLIIDSVADGLVSQYVMNSQNYTADNQTFALDTLGVNNGNWSGKTFNDGTVSGGVTIDDGAMVFDGTNDNVDIGSIGTEIFNTISISTWISTNNQEVELYAFDGFKSATSDNRISIGQHSTTGGKWIALLRTNNSGSTLTLTSNDALTTNTDTSVLVVYDGVNFRMYIDGILQDDVESATGVIDSSLVSNYIIGSAGGNTLNWNGSISQTQIYNKALTQSEITEIYTAGKDSYTPVGDGLIAQYSGRDFAGTTANPTTIYDTNQLVDGKINEGFTFDGVDDAIGLGSILNGNQLNQSLTFSAWIYPLENGDNTIIGDFEGETGERILYWLDTSTTLRQGFIINSAKYGSSIIPLNEWTHIAVTINFTSISFFTNGVIDNGVQVNTANLTLLNNTNIEIGNDNTNTKPFNGSIDDVRIFNRSLTADEITAIYNDGVGTEEYNTGNIYMGNKIISKDIEPETTSLYSIGSSILRYLKGWFVDLDVTGNATINTLNVTTGYTGDCANITYSGGIAISCND